MMNDFVPTHVSIGGVGVMDGPPCGGYRMVHTNPRRLYIQVPKEDFGVLFQPIPKPVMVEIPKDVAIRLGACATGNYLSMSDAACLRAAIERAEKEQNQ